MSAVADGTTRRYRGHLRLVKCGFLRDVEAGVMRSICTDAGDNRACY